MFNRYSPFTTRVTARAGVLALLALTTARVESQAPAILRATASSPEALATLVMETFVSGTPEMFAAIFPDSAGRVFQRESRGVRVSEIAKVVQKQPHRAVLLLGGIARPNNALPRTADAGGNETNLARHFSGFYEAVEKQGEWRISRQIPFDTANFIRKQALQVTVDPAVGIKVVDTLQLVIGAPFGIALRLNNAAQIRAVRLDGRAMEHVFGGGVLWVQAPVKARSELVLSYTLDASRARPASPADSAALPAFGAFHNTDVWHPFFHYLSGNDLAQITATVSIPSQYHLTTTVPQVDTVRNGVRTVYAQNRHESFLLALIYDNAWVPRTTDFGAFRFESFAGPGFRHSHDSLAAVTKRVYDVLAPRFGEPQFPSRYLAAVQDRALGTGGFNVRMNNAAISGGTGGGILESSTAQTFAHETGHAWTLNSTGKGSNFLHEAWATFVEALVLRAWYGADVERTFWERQQDSYMVGADRAGFQGGFEGKQSILGNYDNGRIHYRKGVWILKSGNHVMGDSAFNRGMRLYIAGLGKGPSGYEQLIAAWSKAAGRDMTSFVLPWLTSKYIPNVDAQIAGGRLILTQKQPDELFDLPNLVVELTTARGPVRKTVHVWHRADTVSLAGIEGVTDARVDPDHDFLMQRAWGEPAVRFELPASSAPEGASVALNGNFLRNPMTATRSGNVWFVELPMSEGQHTWLWQITMPGATNNSGAAPDPALTGVRTVRPLQRVTNPYPGR